MRLPVRFLVIPSLVALVAATQVFALDPPKDLDVGIYIAHGPDWMELPVEIVNWKTGGVVKQVLTDGIVKGDLNRQNPWGREPDLTVGNFGYRNPRSRDGGRFVAEYGCGSASMQTRVNSGP